MAVSRPACTGASASHAAESRHCWSVCGNLARHGALSDAQAPCPPTPLRQRPACHAPRYAGPVRRPAGDGAPVVVAAERKHAQDKGRAEHKGSTKEPEHARVPELPREGGRALKEVVVAHLPDDPSPRQQGRTRARAHTHTHARLLTVVSFWSDGMLVLLFSKVVVFCSILTCTNVVVLLEEPSRAPPVRRPPRASVGQALAAVAHGRTLASHLAHSSRSAPSPPAETGVFEWCAVPRREIFFHFVFRLPIVDDEHHCVLAHGGGSGPDAG